LLARKGALAEQAAARAEETRAEAAEALATAEAEAEAAAAAAAEEGAVSTETIAAAAVESAPEVPFPPPLTTEAAAAVLGQWKGLEEDFVASCGASLGELRTLRHRTLRRSAASRSEFVALLVAPDHRQDAVAAAQVRIGWV